MTTTMDLPMLEGFEAYYGIRVSTIGEDGDMVALGHHEPRNTVAAFNAYSRKALGLDNMLDSLGATYDLIAYSLKPMHATIDFRPARSDEWWMTVHPEPQPGSFPVMYWTA